MGTGVLPFFDILNDIMLIDEGSTANTDIHELRGLKEFTLLASFRTEKDIIAPKWFWSITQRSRRIRLVVNIQHPSPDWDGNTGKFTAEFIAGVCHKHSKLFILCGSRSFSESTQDALSLAGFHKSRVILL